MNSKNETHGVNDIHLNGNLVDPLGRNGNVPEPSRAILEEQHRQYELQQNRFQNAQPQLAPTESNSTSSRQTSNNSTPSHSRSHSAHIPHDHYFQPKSNGSTPITKAMYRQQQQEDFQRLQDEEQHLQNILLENENMPKHLVYNTRIRHGFEADYESEQYMSFLAEVRIFHLKYFIIFKNALLTIL